MGGEREQDIRNMGEQVEKSEEPQTEGLFETDIAVERVSVQEGEGVPEKGVPIQEQQGQKPNEGHNEILDQERKEHHRFASFHQSHQKLDQPKTEKNPEAIRGNHEEPRRKGAGRV